MKRCVAESACTHMQASDCLLPFCSRTTVADVATALGGAQEAAVPKGGGGTAA